MKKSAIKLSAVSAKKIKKKSRKLNVEKLFFINLDITNLCLLFSFCILFKSWLANVIKVLLSEVVQANLKTSEPIEA